MTTIQVLSAGGGLLLDLGLVLAGGLSVALAVGWRRERAWQHRLARQGTGALWAVVSLAVGLLLWALLTGQFAFRYVAGHSSLELPPFYRVTALWSGQEGSLLFWLWILTGYAALVARRTAWEARRLAVPAVFTLTVVATFFALLVSRVVHPFTVVSPAPANGLGLNPLLQNYWMGLHPVFLYLGYVGLSVPFAFGIAALLTGETGEAWVRVTRRWSLMGWLFLSAGILFGARWAYEELGWGGYWGWDPVENASFLPWLTATAFIHSIMMQEKRGLLKRWNQVLIQVTFGLTLFGTFITRSGILTSVHAFVESDVGPFFTGFLALAAASCLYLLLLRWGELKDERAMVSYASREASFLFNNLVMTAAAFAIFWGTVFPLVSSLFGVQVTVGPPYFNRVTGPLFVALLLLMGIGPVIAWKRATPTNLRRSFTLPGVVLAGTGAVLVAAGVRELGVVLAWSLAAFVVAAAAVEVAKGVHVRMARRREPALLALPRVLNANAHRYGGYLVHVAVVLIAIGIVASQTYQVRRTAALEVGQEVAVGPYRLLFQGLDEEREGAVPGVAASLVVRQGDRTLGLVRPEKRFFPGFAEREGPTSETAIYSRPGGDLYVVLSGWDPFGATVGFVFYYNPFVSWIWAGGALLVAGTLFALWPRRREAALEGRIFSELAELEADRLAGDLPEAEYLALRARLVGRAGALLDEEAHARARAEAELRALASG
ncbi:heme lyase CcmF/NrfE family subunit [Limnochorda pilosa]|uniref:Cytochrome C biogenesis protein n=1 Tax=Limnochorda pilosa TaxID=1555112 RepID=A0A0K2SFS4_LIMPI|nr:heme lyase CcmF/NrfE family subunit [Limnochorda pilosa]BAS25958.1 cytochrome C biogenesis protein [Limnochorda pilosa]